MFSPATLGVLMLFTGTPGAGQMGTTFEVDPCLFATADRLRAHVERGVGAAFPMSERGVTLSNPRVVAATCPNFRTEVRADLQYRKKTAAGRVSTSGHARFGSPMVAYITYTGGGFPPSPPGIQIAEACLTDIRVLGLDLRGSPNRLDQGWLRSLLSKELEPRKCFSVHQEAISYVQSGGQFQPVATTIRGRPAADHPGTDRAPAPPGEKTEPVFPPGEETAPTRHGGLPDVTANIRQDIMDYGARYRARITVENRGSAAMPPVKVNIYGVPNHHTGTPPPSLEQCMTDRRVSCIRHETTIGPLGPGQQKAFHAGGKQPRTSTLYVHVTIECRAAGTPQPLCPESDTSNNTVTRVLGPH